MRLAEPLGPLQRRNLSIMSGIDIRVDRIRPITIYSDVVASSIKASFLRFPHHNLATQNHSK